MTTKERIENLVKDFSQFKEWEDRYRYVIQLGKTLDPMDEAFKTEDNKVRGCQSQLWLWAEWKDGRIVFTADSDAAIVKGIIALLLKVYSDNSPEDILATRPDFLDTIGLREHLSMNRTNGIASMLKQISLFALGFQTKKQMGLL